MSSTPAVVGLPDTPAADPSLYGGRPYCTYDAQGRLLATGIGGPDLIETLLNMGERVLMLEEALPPAGNTVDLRRYIDLSGAEPVLADRPIWQPDVDTLEPEARQELTIRNAPACTLRFTGPQSGSLFHPEAGPLAVGWTTPGAYRIEIEAFPLMPVDFTVTVRPRAPRIGP